MEELRIGGLEGAPEEIFGRVSFLAADGAGGVYTFDVQASSLRHYDANGRYTHTIGSSGSGPGEYRRVYGLALRTDGRLIVYDIGNARNVYAPDGTMRRQLRHLLILASAALAMPPHAQPAPDDAKVRTYHGGRWLRLVT